jgi:trans-aconitate methyltransferase
MLVNWNFPAMKLEINSLDWWNDYFAVQWEFNHGREQTRHFLSKLVHHLAAQEHRWLSAQPRSILDWGCALGEGVEVLSAEFPGSQVTGLDFSRTAIDKARASHPRHRFILSEGGEISDDYDVIVTSNCLEHYPAPFEIAARHICRTRYLYLVMVPFEETEPLHESHVQRFTYQSFPDQIGNFRRRWITIIPVTPPYWNGAQAIACYASPLYRPRE